MQNTYITINENNIEINLSAITYSSFFSSLQKNMSKIAIYDKLDSIYKLIPNDELDKFTFSDTRLLSLANQVFHKAPELVLDVNIFHVVIYYQYLVYFNDIEIDVKNKIMKYLRLWIAQSQVDFEANDNFKANFIESRLEFEKEASFIPEIIYNAVINDIFIDFDNLIGQEKPIEVEQKVEQEKPLEIPYIEPYKGKKGKSDKEQALTLFNLFIADYDEADVELKKELDSIFELMPMLFGNDDRYVPILAYIKNKFPNKFPDVNKLSKGGSINVGDKVKIKENGWNMIVDGKNDNMLSLVPDKDSSVIGISGNYYIDDIDLSNNYAKDRFESGGVYKVPAEKVIS